MHEELRNVQESRLGCLKRCKRRTVNMMYSCGYFSRLFPNIREEKPGRDFIALINLPLFIAVIFVIIFYSEMAKDSGSLAQSIAENHFSTGMVVFVLVQIAELVLERYIYLKMRQLTIGSKSIEQDLTLEYTSRTTRHLIRQGSTISASRGGGLDVIH